MRYGHAIRIVRSIRDMTQRQLAERCGVNPSFVSLIEDGKRVPRLDVLESIAETLDVSIVLLSSLATEPDRAGRMPKALATAYGLDLMRAITGADAWH